MKSTNEMPNPVIHVPMRYQRTGGRIMVLAPHADTDSLDEVVDRVALTAIANGFHWQAMLENGTYRNLLELAKAKGIDPAYVRKVVNLAYLDPFIIRKLLDARQPSGFTIYREFGRLPIAWDEQRRWFGFGSK